MSNEIAKALGLAPVTGRGVVARVDGTLVHVSVAGSKPVAYPAAAGRRLVAGQAVEVRHGLAWPVGAVARVYHGEG